MVEKKREREEVKLRHNGNSHFAMNWISPIERNFDEMFDVSIEHEKKDEVGGI